MVKKKIFGVAVALAGIGIIIGAYVYLHKNKETSPVTYQASEVTVNTIQNTLSGTGSLEPVKTYSITANVQGEVLSSDFEEGDEVKKGQVLYKISTENLEESIENAQENVGSAQKAYN